VGFGFGLWVGPGKGNPLYKSRGPKRIPPGLLQKQKNKGKEREKRGASAPLFSLSTPLLPLIRGFKNKTSNLFLRVRFSLPASILGLFCA